MNAISATPSPAGSVVKSADRALDLLELFARLPDGLTLAEVCAELGWPKSSTLNLLRTMTARGYVIASNGTASNHHYQLGPKVATLGRAYLERADLGTEGQEIVRTVSRQMDETVHLAVLRGANVLYIAKEEGGGQMRMVSAVGRMIPAHGTGVGKMLLASLPVDELDRLFPPGEDLPRITDTTITDRATFLHTLDRIRTQDFATDDGESTVGLRCIAAPVRDASGKVVAAMSVSVPSPRFTPDRAPMLHRTLLGGAQTLSERLGCPPALLHPIPDWTPSEDSPS
ncbi:MAG: IclR family transcriptional regulator [Thermomicrobiales bacterium]